MTSTTSLVCPNLHRHIESDDLVDLDRHALAQVACEALLLELQAVLPGLNLHEDVVAASLVVASRLTPVASFARSILTPETTAPTGIRHAPQDSSAGALGDQERGTDQTDEEDKQGLRRFQRPHNNLREAGEIFQSGWPADQLAQR